MSLEQTITDKSVESAATATNSVLTKTNKKKPNNSNSSKKVIKKTLRISKTKKHASPANVNNKNMNIKNYSNDNTTTNTSSSGNNNVDVINDEIIEELFDFSDIDLKELDESNHENISSLKLKESEGLDGKSEEQLENLLLISDNNNNKNHNNQIEKCAEEQPLGVMLSSAIDNTDKQNEDNALVTTLEATTTTNVISKTGDVDKKIAEKQGRQEASTPENNCGKETNNEMLLNKDSFSTTPIQISDTSIGGDNSINVEDDNNNMNMSKSSDMKSMKTNNASYSSPLIESNELTTYCNANEDDDSKNDDDDDNEDGYAEPYDELLVQFLGEANHIAEARLAARRHARAEAREIRMRELERQQKEQESNADRVFDMHSTVSGITPMSHMRLGLGSSPVTGLLNSTRGNSMSSRRSSEDSLEEEGRSLRDIRHELKDVEERFRKAMIANAQLDNDRASQTYQIQLLKDKLEDMEESYSQLQRECKEKTRECNGLKRSLDKLNEELKLVQGQLNERDTLIAEQGLVIVAIENEDGTDAKRALVTVENAQLLGSVQGSLDVRLKKFSAEKQQLQSEVQQLQEQLEAYKSQGKGRGKGSSTNGPLGSDDDDYEAQREANKIISDFKYKLQKAEQEIASLQSSLARSETQVIRYKSTAEAAEKAEAELKIERRKLQRENREAMEKLEELETSNNHLLKRLDKLKNAKSALLKDL